MAIHSLGSGAPSGINDKSPTAAEASCFHARSAQQVLDQLGSRLSGLTDEEVQSRCSSTRDNDIDDLDFGRARRLFLGGFRKKVTLLFMAASALAFFTGQFSEGMVILAAMLGYAGIHGLIHWKSVTGQQPLSETSNIRCTVRRGGKTVMIPSRSLVHGDILLLSAGQVVPADCRLIVSDHLQADESPLTGESILVSKKAEIILEPDQAVTAQSNMIFAGSRIKTGKGEAVITAIGRDTVMGKIASLSRDTEKRESLFTRRLNMLGNRVFLLVFVLAALVIAIEAQRGTPWPDLLQVGLILAIAAFPETIPGFSSLILSLGIRRLGERQVLVKNFQALEAIGDVTVLCTDKTGTLTENYLSLDQLYLPELGVVPYDPAWQNGEAIPHRSLEEFLRVARLNNNTVVEGLRSPLMGDPVDVALYRSAPASLEAGYHRRMHIPFDSETMRSATLCEAPDGRVVAMIKGAPESVMEMCSHYMKPDGTLASLSLMNRMELLSYNRRLATENNLRIIGFAEKIMPEDDTVGPFADAVFIGWVCLLDPPKPGAVEAIEQLREAGSRLIMITGDQKATAEITAHELGLLRNRNDEVWVRSDLDQAREDGEAIRETVCVFARTKPEEKLAIVESLQKTGHIVGMVGDGVNDSPALQKSDVAIAMGRQGSDAAKESSDILLLDDRIGGIVDAIRESRLLRGRVRACIQYLLSCNLGLVFFVVASVVSGYGLGLNILQLLCLNLLMTTLPALALALEPTEDYMPEREVMPDPLDRGQLAAIIFWGLLITAIGMISYLVPIINLKLSHAEAGTLAFCALGLAQTLNLFNIQAYRRNHDRETFWSDLLTTPVTWIVLIGAIVLELLAVYITPVSQLLGTASPDPLHLLIPAGAAIFLMGFAIRTSLSAR